MKTQSTPPLAAVDQPRLVLPLDRDGRDEDAPEGYPATNADGTTPRVEGDVIWIKEDYCSCPHGCGGCGSIWFDYPIDGKRFHWENDKRLASADENINHTEK